MNPLVQISILIMLTANFAGIILLSRSELATRSKIVNNHIKTSRNMNVLADGAINHANVSLKQSNTLNDIAVTLRTSLATEKLLLNVTKNLVEGCKSWAPTPKKLKRKRPAQKK